MDSEILSVFHDDYESTFNKYEENYWSVENCDNLSAHLSENLNGILPISPIEEKIAYFDNDLQVDFYSNDITKQEHINICNQNKNFISYTENDPTIQIISVDPDAEFEDEDIDSSDCDEIEHESKNSFYQSDTDHHSLATFRSRTESSSIGDYESHTSDESDYENSNQTNCRLMNTQTSYFEQMKNTSKEIYLNENINVHSKDTASISHIDFVGSSVMVATNNGSESIEIDTEKFDLTKFITEDNFIKKNMPANSLNSNDKSVDNNCGYESEEIVDIETVDDHSVKKCSSETIQQNKISANINNLFEQDNIDKDPSWDPSCKQKIKFHADKFNENQKIKFQETKFKDKIKELKSISNLSIKKKIKKRTHFNGKKMSIFYQSLPTFQQNNVKSKKNVVSNEVSKRFDNKELREKEIKQCLVKCEMNNFEKEKSEDIERDTVKQIKVGVSDEKLSVNANIVPIKKKLNLEEYYKKRKVEQKHCFTNLSKAGPASIIKNSLVTPLKNSTENQQEEKKCFENNSTNLKSLLIPKHLHKEISIETRLDPITEARNKVLRMQELKKQAAQKRLIDIAVSSKVGPVTKILPLEEIVKPNSKHLNHSHVNLNSPSNKSEYEEIIIVSVSCNTDIKIPPKFDRITVNNSSTSLLYNISNTIEKAKTNENLKISNNSLITSIKSVVLQKSVQEILPINSNEVNTHNGLQIEKNKNIKINSFKNKNERDEHGEDKIIMHLPRNRIKQKTCSISTQTEPLPEFPLLELIMPAIIKSGRNRNYKNRKYRYRKEVNLSLSSDSDEETDSEYNNSKTHSERYGSQNRISSSGLNQLSSPENYYNYSNFKGQSAFNSLERERDRSRRKLRRHGYRTRNYSGSGHSTSSSYRSRSSSFSDESESRSKSAERKFHRSRLNYYKNYKKSKNKNDHRENSPAVEERRIVYVGRIEHETTKEDLKRKFIGYGPIKQITLHYKDTGMKYGFVTYEKSGDAFKAIDNGTTDLKINMYDISFGGRRAFCRQSYADLDGAATNTFQLYSYGSIPSSRNSVLSNNGEEDSFESLLNKVKEKLCASKSTSQKT